MQKVRIQLTAALGKPMLSAALLLCSTAVMAQSQKTGVITDSNGEPLVGVTVMEQGTKNGTVTDANGRYRITTTKPGAKLTISYVGYADQVITPGRSVSMKEDDATLNEVVVVGYGTMRRKDVTSSITTVEAKDLNQGVYTDPASLLQGKVAGLTVTQNGDPSGTPTITLRGASTIRTDEGAAEPYYVIDGIPGMDLSLVAPEDIESIDVLRDASATAIYGSKAANGVIIITTKKGKAGKTNVTYSGYVAFDRVLKNLDMMSASELRQYAADNNLTLPNDKGADTDWQDEVQRTAISHNHNVTISGGYGKTTYNASVNYMNREGTIRGTDFQRLNARALVQTDILKDHLNLALGINASEDHFSSLAWNKEGASVGDAMNYYSPLVPVRNEDGSWYEDLTISQNYNPLAMINEDKMKNKHHRFQLTTKATVKIIDGLTWTANYTYSNRQNLYSAYNSINSQTDLRHGAANRDSQEGHSQTFETYGNFNKTFGQHSLGLMAGYSWEENHRGDGFGVTVYNFYNDEVGYHNLSYASSMDGIDGLSNHSESVLRMISFYGRLNYSFASRYNLQATIRRDGSSAFGRNNRWGTFPSVSAAWRISEEPWMKKNGIFDDLKLRVGYGISGNSLGFDAFSALATYGASGWFTYTDGKQYRTLAATRNANPDLKWEKTGMWNFGLDFALFNSRLSGTVEYYIKKTSDLIYRYKVSQNIYPYDWMWANVGDITNKGIEVTINAVPVKTRNFSWQTSLNLAHNKNTVDKISNAQFSSTYIDVDDSNPNLGGYATNNIQRIIEGEPIGTFYMWEWAGYNDDGKSVFYVHDPETNERTGEVTDSPTDKDRTIVGNAQPKLNMGWNNTLNYKNWNFNAFFTGVFGNKIFNAMRAQYNLIGNVTTGKNVLKEVATKQRVTDLSASDAPSDRYLESGSYFRLSSLSLGYTFRNCFNNWINSLQLYGTVNNVFTITGYEGIDPEVKLGGLTPGIDWRSQRFPHNRSFIVGVKIDFGGAVEKKVAVAPDNSEIDRLNDEVNRLRTENDQLRNRKPEKQVVTNTVEVTKTYPYVVNFRIGSSDVVNREKVNLEAVASMIKSTPNKKYRIVGYADRQTGSQQVNAQLSKDRAQKVFDLLTQQYGVSADSLIVDSKGGVDTMYLGDPQLSRCVIVSE